MHAGDRAAWLVQPDISVALQRVLLELLKPCWTPTPNQYRRTSYCHVGQDSPVIIWTLKQRKEQFNCQNSWQSRADERFSRGNPDHAFQVVCLKHVVKVVISNHSSTKASERSRQGRGVTKEGSFTCPLSQRESNEENKTDRKVEVLFQVRDFKNFH